MGFELTGATPDERLKELTEKLEQGVSEIFTSGRYAELSLIHISEPTRPY